MAGRCGMFVETVLNVDLVGLVDDDSPFSGALFG